MGELTWLEEEVLKKIRPRRRNTVITSVLGILLFLGACIWLDSRATETASTAVGFKVYFIPFVLILAITCVRALLNSNRSSYIKRIEQIIDQNESIYSFDKEMLHATKVEMKKYSFFLTERYITQVFWNQGILGKVKIMPCSKAFYYHVIDYRLNGLQNGYSINFFSQDQKSTMKFLFMNKKELLQFVEKIESVIPNLQPLPERGNK